MIVKYTQRVRGEALKKMVYLPVFLAVAGCTNPDVSKEMKQLSDSVGVVQSELDKKLTPLLDEEREKQAAIASKSTDIWRLSTGCSDLTTYGAIDTLPDCQVVMNPEPQELGPRAAKRKMSVLVNYINALSLLASDDPENALTEGYSAAISGLDALGKESGSDSLGKFTASLLSSQQDANGVLEFAVRNARVQKLRKITKASKEDFALITQEVLDIISSVNAKDSGYVAKIDPKLDELAQKAEEAGSKMAAARGQVAREQAMLGLLKAQHDLVEYEPKSIVGLLRRMAVAHSGLSDRLQRDATLDEVSDSLDSLKALTTAVKGLIDA